MKPILKVALASGLIANSAFAMNPQFFAGLGLGITSNNLKNDKDTSTEKAQVASPLLNIEAGAVMDLTETFLMSAEIFGEFNMLSTKEKDYGYEAKQQLSYGVQTRMIFKAMSNTHMYGKVGVGMTKLEVNNLSENSMLAKLGLGVEYMVSDNLGMFTEFNYDILFKKVESKDKKNKFSNNPYSIKFGARYFF